MTVLALTPKRSERGLCPRNFPWGEALEGGNAPLRLIARPLALFTVEAGKLTFVRYLAPPAPSP